MAPKFVENSTPPATASNRQRKKNWGFDKLGINSGCIEVSVSDYKSYKSAIASVNSATKRYMRDMPGVTLYYEYDADHQVVRVWRTA